MFNDFRGSFFLLTYEISFILEQGQVCTDKYVFDIPQRRIEYPFCVIFRIDFSYLNLMQPKD